MIMMMMLMVMVIVMVMMMMMMVGVMRNKCERKVYKFKAFFEFHEPVSSCFLF